MNSLIPTCKKPEGADAIFHSAVFNAWCKIIKRDDKKGVQICTFISGKGRWSSSPRWVLPTQITHVGAI